MNYNIAYLSYNDDDVKLKNRSEQILDQFFGTESYSISSTEESILFIASGGSEQNADRITQKHQNIVLLCHRENNSYAATMEIAAFLKTKEKRVQIIDVLAPDAFKEFEDLQKINRALESLSTQKAALIGEVSNWLIISDVDDQLTKKRLGIEILRIPWDELDNYAQKEVSTEFLDYFPKMTPEKLHETSKVYRLLQEVIEEKKLAAISVECFSMVVRDKVTACLPLAVLNEQNKVAACEGDICSMLGKMLILALTNQVPWQSNIAEIKQETILFAHCTAPLNLLKSFDITTHFETNCGTAIRGKFEKQAMGVFRINNTLDQYTLLTGDIVQTPDHDFACRTQIELEVGQKQTEFLKNKSLGNHQLLFPATYIPLLERMMLVLGISKVE